MRTLRLVLEGRFAQHKNLYLSKQYTQGLETLTAEEALVAHCENGLYNEEDSHTAHEYANMYV